MALVKSFATGITKGAWKTGSHSWKATRRWLKNRGYVGKGEPVHHAIISNATGKKYNIEWFVNQPWNMKVFKTQSEHMRYGHGKKYLEELPGNIIEQLWKGTSAWPKALVGSYGGRMVITITEEE